MAKRFIDTELFNDNWFMELSISGKLLWVYCITTCDHAGILKLNPKLCQFQTGIKELPRVIQELGNRMVTVEQDLYFIPKFLLFQYPGFPKSGAPQQHGAIKILEKYQLFKDGLLTLNKEYSNSIETVIKELPNSIGDGKGNGDGNELFPEEIEKVFSEFLKMRIKLKKEATPYAVKLLRKKLRTLSQSKQSKAIEILNQSITNGWKDLFEIKNNIQPNDNSNKFTRAIDTTNRVIAKLAGEIPVDQGTIQS